MTIEERIEILEVLLLSTMQRVEQLGRKVQVFEEILVSKELIEPENKDDDN